MIRVAKESGGADRLAEYDLKKLFFILLLLLTFLFLLIFFF